MLYVLLSFPPQAFSGQPSAFSENNGMRVLVALFIPEVGQPLLCFLVWLSAEN